MITFDLDDPFAQQMKRAIERAAQMEPATVPAPRAQPRTAPAGYCLPPNVKYTVPARRHADGQPYPRLVVYVRVHGSQVDVMSFAATPENVPIAARIAEVARTARDQGLDAAGVRAAARAAAKQILQQKGQNHA